jgi:putative flippase GtrA
MITVMLRGNDGLEKRNQMTKKTASTTGQVARFGLVGIMNTAIDYTLFISLTWLFSIPLDRVWMAKLVSGSVAMINSFFFNRNWVFRRSGNRQQATQQLARFLLSTLVAVFVIQLGLTQLFTSELPQLGHFVYTILEALGLAGLDLPVGAVTEEFTIKTVAFGLATIGSLTWNFLLYKLWAFKE